MAQRRDARTLPVLLYPAGPCFPWASRSVAWPRGHRVWQPEAKRGRKIRRGPAWRLLLAGLLLGLLTLVATLPRPAAPPLAARQTAAPDPRAIPESVRHRPPPARWDTTIHAHPRKGQFIRFFRMTVTAYTPINTRMEGGRYTCTRRDGRSAHGVAVDPDLIPLGSRLWIPGYGHAVADDVGGRIRGHHVDLRVQVSRHMSGWGVRRVRVYVLQEPKTR